MNKVSVFRNGSMTVSEYTGEVKMYSDRADAAKPDDRAGRAGSLYATPDLHSVTRWVNAHITMRAHRDFDLETYEFKVDADEVYVYPIPEWERFSWSRDPVPADTYWNAGITLTEFLATPGLDSKEWEVLVKPEQVLSAPRRVSRKRLVSADESLAMGLKNVGIK